MNVSIIIINYNTFQLTSNCIRSIYTNTQGVKFEIILVDNASTECDADRFKEEFPGIVLLKNKENLGFAKGNNSGITLAKGDLILLLNSDTELIEDSITMCCEKLNKLGEGVGAMTCKLIYPDGTIQKQCYRFPSNALELTEIFRIHKLFYSEEKRSNKLMGAYFDNKSDIEPDWVWGTFFMFRKEQLHRMPEGKLNEAYFMYCEDMKWCYELKTMGKRIYYYSGTKLIHKVGKSAPDGSWKQSSIVANELDFVRDSKSMFYALNYASLRFINLMLAGWQNKDHALLYVAEGIKLLKKD